MAKATYLACTEDLSNLYEAEKIVSELKKEMGAAYKIFFQKFGPDKLLTSNKQVLKTKQVKFIC